MQVFAVHNYIDLDKINMSLLSNITQDLETLLCILLADNVS